LKRRGGRGAIAFHVYLGLSSTIAILPKLMGMMGAIAISFVAISFFLRKGKNRM
jgi:hypothetical protein